jgi:diguanylate cyclase (GGDEF)-like protein
MKDCEQHYLSFLEQSSAGICRLDLDPPIPVSLPPQEQVNRMYAQARLAECNQAFAEMYGLDNPDSALGTRLGEFFLPESEAHRALLHAFVAGEYRLADAGTRVVQAGGGIRHLLNNLTGTIENETLTLVWAAQLDVTHLRTTEDENVRLAAFPRENPNPILECDANGFPIYVNPAAGEVVKRLGVDLYDFLPPNHLEIITSCIRSQDRTSDVEVVVADRVFSWVYQPVQAVGTVHLYATDVTEQKRAEEFLHRNALQDALTGLPNRALLMDRLEHAVDLVGRHEDYHFAVLWLDLDRFKVINDSIGHAAGDQLLVEVTDRLKRCVKQSDTVARTGGDEFVILMEDIGSPGNVTRIADRIQKELTRVFLVGKREVFLTASMGITMSPSDSHHPADLLRDAETAMYRSKAEGRSRYTVFDVAIHKQTSEQLQLETDLRQAIEKGELSVHYQPVVALHSEEIAGFEALVRWNHPRLGRIGPDRFIPLAEECGLIGAIDEWVMYTACKQNQAWHQSGFTQLSASVNLSGSELHRRELFDRIARVLADTGLPPRFLKVEVTESVAARDPVRAAEVLGRLRDMGIQVMIDDFGTGYSALSYLKGLPADVLKIDRSFVKDIHTDPGSAAIVTTVVLMAHALGFEVVAEGVEEKAQLDILRRHNCDFAQGYLYSRPIPADEFTALLQRGVESYK